MLAVRRAVVAQHLAKAGVVANRRVESTAGQGITRAIDREAGAFLNAERLPQFTADKFSQRGLRYPLHAVGEYIGLNRAVFKYFAMLAHGLVQAQNLVPNTLEVRDIGFC